MNFKKSCSGVEKRIYVAALSNKSYDNRTLMNPLTGVISRDINIYCFGSREPVAHPTRSVLDTPPEIHRYHLIEVMVLICQVNEAFSTIIGTDFKLV